MDMKSIDKAQATLAELGTLYPQPKLFTIAGKSVQIMPSTIRAGTRVLALALALWAMRQSDDDDELVLVDEHPTETIELLAVATGMDVNYLSALSANDKYELGLAWMEVNAAFFVLRPYLLRLRMDRTLGAVMSGVGLTPSMPLLKQDTRTPATTPRQRRYVISKQSTERNAARVGNA